MCQKYYRACEICGGAVHMGSYCDCMEKADPWGALKRHVDMNRQNIKVLKAIEESARDLQDMINDARKDT